MKPIVISVDYLREDTRLYDDVVGLHYRKHYTHFMNTTPTFNRIFGRFKPELFVTDWFREEGLKNTCAKNGVKCFVERELIERDVLKSLLSQDLFIWVHFWQAAHTLEMTLENYDDVYSYEMGRLTTQIKGLLRGVDRPVILTADHGIVLDKDMLGKELRGRRTFTPKSSNVPLVLVGAENKEVISPTNHDGLCDYLNGKKMPTWDTMSCYEPMSFEESNEKEYQFNGTDYVKKETGVRYPYVVQGMS